MPDDAQPLFRLPDGRAVHAQRVRFAAARSGGPGGQNVNRRETKVELRVQVADLPLTPDEATRLRERLGNRITQRDELVVQASEARTQGDNRRLATTRLARLVTEAIAPEEPRVATRVPPAQRRARLADKERRATRLAARRPSTSEDG